VPDVVETIAGLRARLRATPQSTVALVPTMGALHDGHLALVDRARELADIVVVSIFVNPLQFGRGEDLDRYPRTLDADLATLGRADLVFAPSATEMYPDGASQTRVIAGPVAALFEGASRPGHFDGVLTVVAKLFGIVQPQFAVFGQKDAQQLFLVRRMVTDLNLPVVVEAVPIVREADGLALSSRNRFLGEQEKRAALTLSRALRSLATSGDLATARAVVASEESVGLDYLEIVSPSTFLPVGDDHGGEALAIVAAKVGSTRLIDNEAIHLG
jgi:pantoate--beta-alanine ligase